MEKKISQESITIIKQTASLVTEHAIDITTNMYQLLFSKYPHMKNLFSNAPDNQNVILAEAISAYAVNIDNLKIFTPALEVIAYSHVKENIQAIHYPILGIIFIQALEKSLGSLATLEFIDAWREAYKVVAEILIEMEREMYEAKGINL